MILDTLLLLNARLSEPVWLFGGVAVDFLVGPWTRPHGDIDLHAFADSRERLIVELEAIGFRSSDRSWLTHWRRDNRPEEVYRLRRSRGESAAGSARIVRHTGCLIRCSPVGEPRRSTGRYRHSF
jgi:hypothetical protein